MTEGTRVLLVEDDEDLAGLVRMHLTDQGYDVTVSADGEAGLKEAQIGGHDLVILDVMLPRMDGFEICRQIRAAGIRHPVLMLTSRSEEIDRVLGLELGADDYLTKPFSLRELEARVKALLRRSQLASPEPDLGAVELRFGGLVINLLKRTVELDGAPVELTSKEFDLLELFARHPGRAFSRQELLARVWGYDYEGYSHTVNTHINRLRGKLDDNPADPRFIKTVWGHGYAFVEPDEV